MGQNARSSWARDAEQGLRDRWTASKGNSSSDDENDEVKSRSSRIARGRRRSAALTLEGDWRRPGKARLLVLVLTVILSLYGLTRWFEQESAVQKSQEARLSVKDAAPWRPIDVNPRPTIRKAVGGADEKFMAYLPHSGYHNQRISLENALVVAKMLNRTLLVPPVWLGHSIPYIAFDKLYDRVIQARKDGLEHCKDVPAAAATPFECLGGYWDYTVVSWDFLVDMHRIAASQPIVERWDMSYTWLEQELGINVQKDIAFIKDSKLYEWRIYDTANDTAPLDKFEKRLNFQQIREMSENHKLVHFGSLFGTTRVRLLDPDNYAARSLARASMVFQNEHLQRITDTVKERLGGGLAYYGVHLRLGDGVFQENAAKNAEALFDDLCMKKMGIYKLVVDHLKAKKHIKRDASFLTVKNSAASQTGPANMELAAVTDQLARRDTDAPRPDPSGTIVSVVKKGKQDPHTSLPPLVPIASRALSPLHRSLSCRKALHQDPALLPFNVPLYLATDSKSPESDPALCIFYDTFPCLFTLADFSAPIATVINSEPVDGFAELSRLRNNDDGVMLGGFMQPLIDAMIAAKGRDMLGTPGSTFSQFAVDVLHRVYHDWPIVERG